jgi:hemolysin activation/secretion protein
MKLKLDILAFAVALGSISSLAQAQSLEPSRVTPSTFAPAPVGSGGAITFGAVEPGQVPAGADRLSVLVGDIVVEGGAADLQGDIAAATGKVRGQRVSARALYGVAAEIEAAYARAGFILTRVSVPPQQLKDGGTFRILVVDGFIEAIDASAVPESQRGGVVARVTGLVGVKGLRLADIERKLLIAGDMAGLKLRSALIKGSQVGGARLVLEADWRPVSASIGVDNKVGSVYRGVEYTASASLNSLFGQGEQIYGSAITGPDAGTLFNGSPIRRVYGIGAQIPLGVDGSVFNPEYTRSDTNPRVFLPATPTMGVFERWAFRGLYPIVKTRSQTLTALGSFEIINEQQNAPTFGTVLNLDRLRIFTAGLDATKSLGWNANIAAGFLVTQGIDALGARDQADVNAAGGTPTLTRQGSRPDYTKVEGHLRYDQALPYDFTFAAILRGQQAISGPMPSSAQFALDGDDGLSAFALGTLSADSGYTVRGEFGRPVTFSGAPFAGVVAPYLFAAFGEGTLDNPSAVEPNVTYANALGGGIRFTLAEQSTGLTSVATIEIGQTHSTITANSTRVTASWTLRY